MIIDELKKEYAGKKVLVMGLGLQGGGVGVARFFAELGANVTVTDKKTAKELQSSIDALKDFDIRYVLGTHDIHDFLSADVIFKGPSVRWDSPEIKAAEEKGIPIEMELSFVAQHSLAKIIGVTGTRGKSTTTQMIYEALSKNGIPVYLGGNIPQISTIDLLKKLTPTDILLMELPSWPLSGFHRKKISPHIAVFTNFYPDHLNYYKSMDEYLYDKKAIYLYQKKDDFLIANKSLEIIIQKDTLQSTAIYVTRDDFPWPLEHLRGDHNRENAALALQVGQMYTRDGKVAAHTIAQCKGVPYRQQLIRTIEGIDFINDTTSTTPIATIAAIKSFNDKPIVLILGGNSKGLPTDELIDALQSVGSIVFLKGTFTDEIFPHLLEKYPEKISKVFDNIEKAVKNAFEQAKLMNVKPRIIFSPAATSFAMFRNEFHRGEEFNRVVKEIL